MLRICFVKHGSLYSSEYVGILADMIRRNLPDGFQGEFNCFTEDATGLDASIRVRQLPDGVSGWWNKLYLFKDGHFDDGDRIVYFDLDTVIVGALDAIIGYEGNWSKALRNGPLAILRDFYRPRGLQSSIMAWQANTLDAIWSDWVMAGYPKPGGGDQSWIESVVKKRQISVDIWQDVFPKTFVSFKKDCGKFPPRGAKVVVFHGHPRPHEATAEWVHAVWKTGGAQGFDLEHVCNTEETKILANVHHCMTLGVPWLEKKPKHDGEAVILGGGPSLALKLDEIRWRIANTTCTVFATNNTLAFLQANGINPDFHVLLDARPENADFITSLPPHISTLIASQCDAATFHAAASSACHITAWHPLIDGIAEVLGNDPRPVHLAGAGSTVGLKTIAIAYIQGFRTFHLYGMDSCYFEERHHAYAQPLNDGERVLDVQANDRLFRCAPWMVQQANEFQELAAALANEGCTITVAGDGLLAHIAREMMKPGPPNAADERAKAILSRLPEGEVVGAEIGVFAGDLSSRLLARENLRLFMVDSWLGDGASYAPGADDFHAGLSQAQQDAYKARAMAVTDFAAGRRIVKQSASSEAMHDMWKCLDFVFIDADHSYEACKQDIANWYPVVKDGGLLSGHDYDHPDFPAWGVKRAVDEFARSHGLNIELGENMTWFITKPLAKEIAA